MRPQTQMCGRKVRYRYKRRALHVLRDLQKYSVRELVPVRAYLCPHCNGWHLTAQTELNDCTPSEIYAMPLSGGEVTVSESNDA